MSEFNHAGGSEQSVHPYAQARGDLIEPTPLTPATGIVNPVLTRPSPSVLVLEYGRRTVISAWLLRGFLLIVLPICALWSVLEDGGWLLGWFLALSVGGCALYFWCIMLLHLIVNKPVALARFDQGSRCFSTRSWFGLHRRRLPLSEVGAVQLVSYAGNT
jgi:hypothetical protein